MKRLEYKYQVPVSALPALREQLNLFMIKDDYVQEDTGQYSVRSIYFDTYALDYYYQKESGIQHRRKMRLRGYNQRSEHSQAFLEIKRKDNMSISKARAPFYFGDVQALFSSGDIDRYIRESPPRARSDARAFFFQG